MESKKEKSIEEEKTIKFFVGGVSHDTNSQTLRDYFSKYGEVRSSEVMRDRFTGLARGFGFVVLSEDSAINQVLHDSHVILGKTVEVKVARPKGWKEPFWEGRLQNIELGESSNSPKNKKIFIGGVPVDLTVDELRQHFENYGPVTQVEIRHPRGFGFVTFGSEEAAERALKSPFQYLKNKRVEVKVAEAKRNVGFSGYNGIITNMGSSIFPIVSYPYGFMASWYYYGWQNGFGYSGPWITTDFSNYSHYYGHDQGNISARESQHKNGNTNRLSPVREMQRCDEEDGNETPNVKVHQDDKNKTNGDLVHQEDRSNGEVCEEDTKKRSNDQLHEGNCKKNGEINENQKLG